MLLRGLKIWKAFIYITYRNVNCFCKIKFSNSLLKSRHLIKCGVTENNVVKQWHCLIKHCPVCCSVPPRAICRPKFQNSALLFGSSWKQLFSHCRNAGKALEYLFIWCVKFIVCWWFVWSGLKPCLCQHCRGFSPWPFQMKESVVFLPTIIQGNYSSCCLGPLFGPENKHLGKMSALHLWANDRQAGRLLVARTPGLLFEFLREGGEGHISETWICFTAVWNK